MRKLLIYYCAITSVVFCANILVVIPTPSLSHHLVLRPLLLELSRKGHKVTSITSRPINHPDIKEIDVYDISIQAWNKYTVLATGAKDAFFNQIDALYETYTNTFKAYLDSNVIQKLGKEKFDLIIVEVLATPTLILSHILNAPVIRISTFSACREVIKSTGNPKHSLMFPSYSAQTFNKPNFWDDVKVVYKQYILDGKVSKYEEIDNAMLQEYFGNDIPKIDELAKNTDLVILNSNPVWNLNRPLSNNVVMLGGLHHSNNEDISKDLKDFLDKSKNGAIYISFGTTSSLTDFMLKAINIFFKILSKLPHKVLLKWNYNKLQDVPENFYVSEWFPQESVLNHSNTRLFITQGGLHSSEDAINAEVPMIGVPLLTDQWYNTELYEKFGIGIRLNIASLSEEIVADALNKMLTNNSYKENIRKLKSSMWIHPISAVERGVWWIEYVLLHGGRHLQPASVHTTCWDYYEMELILMILVTVFTISALILLIVKRLIKNIILL